MREYGVQGVTPSPLIGRGNPAECKADGAKVSARIVQRVRNERSEIPNPS